MSPLPVIDPLEAVDLLAEEISGADGMPADMGRLIRAIDTLIYSLHGISVDGADAGRTGREPPQSDYGRTYAAVASRYPALGHYWLALHPLMQDGTEGELAVADAIDDLTDILIGLGDVRWFRERLDRTNALAVLRARYDMHLWMHVHSLRQYLEEVRRDG